jgi:hypothetical protein
MVLSPLVGVRVSAPAVAVSEGSGGSLNGGRAEAGVDQGMLKEMADSIRTSLRKEITESVQADVRRELLGELSAFLRSEVDNATAGLRDVVNERCGLSTGDDQRLDHLETLAQEHASAMVKLQELTQMDANAPIELDADIDEIDNLYYFATHEARTSGTVADSQLTTTRPCMWLVSRSCVQLLWPTSARSVVQCVVLHVALICAQYVLAFAFMDTVRHGYEHDYEPLPCCSGSNGRTRVRPTYARARLRAFASGSNGRTRVRRVPAQSWLTTYIGQFPLFADPIAFTNFYEPSAAIGTGGDMLQINVTTSVVSLLLLSILMHRDNMATLMADHPIDRVLNQDWPTCARRQPLLLLWRSVAAVLLWFFWVFRALLVPSLAAVGAALALAGSATADGAPPPNSIPCGSPSHGRRVWASRNLPSGCCPR